MPCPIDVNPLYLDNSGKLWVWLSRLHAELCRFYHIHLHSPVSKNFSQNLAELAGKPPLDWRSRSKKPLTVSTVTKSVCTTARGVAEACANARVALKLGHLRARSSIIMATRCSARACPREWTTAKCSRWPAKAGFKPQLRQREGSGERWCEQELGHSHILSGCFSSWQGLCQLLTAPQKENKQQCLGWAVCSANNRVFC